MLNMSDKQKFNLLNKHRKSLSSLLDSHVDKLIESFYKINLLTESEVATIRKPDQQKSKIDLFLDIIINKVGKGDSDDCFYKLISFMRDAQVSNLLDLAKKMTIHQQDIDVPYGQEVQPDSGPPSPPQPVYEKQRMFTIYCISLCMYVCAGT